MFKRLKLLACKVLYREISLLSSKSDNFIDVTYLQQGLHDTPDILRSILQNEIDRIDEGSDIYSCRNRDGLDFDAILLAYGLCSNAICGLMSKKYKLVIPRAHDCITLFLGSKERYKQYFDEHNGGVFCFTPGWNECTIFAGRETIEQRRERYANRYDEENADYLIEQEQKVLEKYNTCAYIDWDELHLENHIRNAEKYAESLKLNFDLIKGDPSLLRNMINGNWREDDFLILEPGCKATQSFDDKIILQE